MSANAKLAWFGLLPILILLSACAIQDPLQPPVNAVHCRDPRPQNCTMIYTPVCATRDNGRRCATTPCETTETATYANACGACSDAQVYYLVAGACSE